MAHPPLAPSSRASSILPPSNATLNMDYAQQQPRWAVSGRGELRGAKGRPIQQPSHGIPFLPSSWPAERTPFPMGHGAQPHFGHLFQGDLAVATSLAPFPSYVRHLHGLATRKCCAQWCVVVRVIV